MPASNALVIIGTGLAGYTLAREFRKLDKDTPLCLITSDDGAFYSKPLLSTGFSKGQTAEQLAMKSAPQMAEELNAQILTHTQVLSIDRQQQRLQLQHQGQQDSVEYQRLVLATGAKVRRPDLMGEAVDEVFSVNNLHDYSRLRAALEGKQQVAILGAGLIGCEFANDLLNGGFEVSVIAPDTQPLPALLPEALGRALRHKLAAQGVRWHLRQSAIAVEPEGDGYRIWCDGGDKIRAERVISAIGLIANTELAQQAGLQVNRGVVVDRHLQTSDENLYALGDCAEVSNHLLMYVLPLMSCARALAHTLTGNPTQVCYPAMPITVKTPGLPVCALPPASRDGEWQIEGEDGDLKAEFVAPDGRLLGFALTGKRVTERMQLVKRATPLF